MIFAAGYQKPQTGEYFADIIRDYRPAVGEVYFALAGTASGRPVLSPEDGGEQLEDLRELREAGVKLDLLFNANCYGPEAVAQSFADRIQQTLSALRNLDLLPEIVTTTTPFVAAEVKKFSPEIENRLSVNCRLDSTLAAEYLFDLFDSFYVRRDKQRDLAVVREFSGFCHKYGKKVGILANSGCLRNCPYQTFHDNLVAHDQEMRQREMADFLPHLCRRRYQKGENLADFLRSTWLRPEDIVRYEPYVDVVKLATRIHPNPRLILEAYTSGIYHGDLLSLTEPGFGKEFHPVKLLNDGLPDNWLDIAAGACADNCTHCGKCEKLLEKAVFREPEELQESPKAKNSKALLKKLQSV